MPCASEEQTYEGNCTINHRQNLLLAPAHPPSRLDGWSGGFDVRAGVCSDSFTRYAAQGKHGIRIHCPRIPGRLALPRTMECTAFAPKSRQFRSTTRPRDLRTLNRNLSHARGT